jgi:polyhydroxyalkanoate synthesis repressor PhaR
LEGSSLGFLVEDQPAVSTSSQKDLAEIRQKMRDASPIDLDSHMGGDVESKRGLAWLRTEREKKVAVAASAKRPIGSGDVRRIKRYSNRKLYDTQDLRNVTLSEIAGLIRKGDSLQVIDGTTQQDLTATTMAQIIFEEEKRGPRLPIAELRRIIVEKGLTK